MKLGSPLKQAGSREHVSDGYVLQYLKDSERVGLECRNPKSDKEGKAIRNRHNSQSVSLFCAEKKKEIRGRSLEKGVK